MAAIGVGLFWFSYWWGLGGLSLVKGWNNNVLQLANPLRPPQFTKACYVGDGIWPTGRPADSGTCKGGPPSGASQAAQRATARRSVTGTVAGSRL